VKAARVDDASAQILEKFKRRREKLLEPWVLERNVAKKSSIYG
jgi:hypothetical protein